MYILNFQIDVFSFGMFLYELITLLKPFELSTEHPDSLIRKEQRPQIPKSKVINFRLLLQDVYYIDTSLYRKISLHSLFSTL